MMMMVMMMRRRRRSRRRKNEDEGEDEDDEEDDDDDNNDDNNNDDDDHHHHHHHHHACALLPFVLFMLKSALSTCIFKMRAKPFLTVSSTRSETVSYSYILYKKHTTYSTVDYVYSKLGIEKIGQ